MFAIKKRIDNWFGNGFIDVNDKKSVGKFGENVATQYLRHKKKFKIITRNWKKGHGEIDIVCWDIDVLVFVEVRTRSIKSNVTGYYSINKKKKEILRSVCKSYLSGLNKPPKNFRFDVVELKFSHYHDYSIHHFQNVALFNKFDITK